MEKYKRHIVADMDESKVQCCIICGEIICDYRNILYNRSDGETNIEPQGYGAGELWVRKGNPTHYLSEEPKEGFENCKA